ncbi:DUF2306 domain-containing protein [Pararhodobacter sp. SW119]|uniref:DUF2306 domain-containing protein n=1 Tax=Pararhodobacter sp. SW119 TaxID=2780075 RepID=UPI001AE0DDCC|nr:DUF2306 domain-containing protein [Pararhodobacter sp. SW119]
MIRLFVRPMPLALILIFATFIPMLMAGVRIVQIPAELLPEDSLRLTVAPVSHWLHSIAGLLFGLLGPLQFARALRARFGVLHRLSGRVFVVAGLGMALSGLALLAQVESIATALLDIARAAFSVALFVALVLGVRAARVRDRSTHRAWMIRAYAIGMGGATVALVMFPIYLINGAPITGHASDLVFVSWWLVTIGLGERVIAQTRHKEVYQ